MRILHVAEAFGGGVYEMVLALATGMAKDHEVTVAYALRPETPPDFASQNPSVRFQEIPCMVRAISPSNDIKAVFALRDLIKKLNPDVVHLHSSKAGALGRLACLLAGKTSKVFYTPHGYSQLAIHFSEKKRKVYRLIEKLLGFLPCATIACGNSEYLEAKTLTRKAYLICNGIDETIGQALRNQYPISQDKASLTVACLGRTSAQKNPSLFDLVARDTNLMMEACGKPPIRFLWIGGGDSFQFRHADSTGWLKKSEALEVLAREADIYFSPAIFEGMPLAVLEAMALSLPLVLSDIPGHKDCVPLLLPANGKYGTTPKELAESIEHFVLHPDIRLKAGLKSRSLIQDKFNTRQMLKQYLKAYQE